MFLPQLFKSLSSGESFALRKFIDTLLDRIHCFDSFKAFQHRLIAGHILNDELGSAINR